MGNSITEKQSAIRQCDKSPTYSFPTSKAKKPTSSKKDVGFFTFLSYKFGF